MSRKPLGNAIPIAINKYINTAYDTILLVAQNLDSIKAVADQVTYLNTYLGESDTPPTKRPNGDPLESGDFYYDNKAVYYYEASDQSWTKVDPEELKAAAQTALDSANTAVQAKDEAVIAADKAKSYTLGTDIGDYTDNPTFNIITDYVVYGRGTAGITLWKVEENVALPYTVNSTTYSHPSDDPNLRAYTATAQLYTYEETTYLTDGQVIVDAQSELTNFVVYLWDAASGERHKLDVVYDYTANTNNQIVLLDTYPVGSKLTIVFEDIGQNSDTYIKKQEAEQLYGDHTKQANRGSANAHPASSISLSDGGSAQDRFNDLGDFEVKESSWAGEGGKSVTLYPSITYKSDDFDSTIVLSGRGVDDPNNEILPDGRLRVRNSYANFIGWVRTGTEDIGGVTYDLLTKVTYIYPLANPELTAVVGGGDNTINGLATSAFGAFHCDTTAFVNHGFLYGGTYNRLGGFYSTVLGGTNNECHANRGLISNSFQCRIGQEPATYDEAVLNASLTRHSKITGGEYCTLDASHSHATGYRNSSNRNFSEVTGFGASNSIFGARTHSSAPFNQIGDNQVSEVVMSRTSTTGTATNLLTTTDMTIDPNAETQEKVNANGGFPLSLGDTVVLVTGSVIGTQTNGDGLHVSEFKAVVSTLSGSAVIESESENVLYSNRNTEVPSTSYEVDVNYSNGYLYVRGKGLSGETVRWQFSGSIKQIRILSGTISPLPKPFI